MKTITYLSPIPRLDKKTGQYIKDVITLYNVKLVKAFGHKVYEGTTTPRGSKLSWCCPSKITSLRMEA